MKSSPKGYNPHDVKVRDHVPVCGELGGSVVL
jgi:hypothetical protein